MAMPEQERLGVLEVHREHAAKHLAHDVEARGQRRGRERAAEPAQRGGVLIQPRLHELAVQLVLVAEVAVEAAHARLGALRDVGDLRRVHAALGEQLGTSAREPLAQAVAILLGADRLALALAPHYAFFQSTSSPSTSMPSWPIPTAAQPA